MILLLDNFDSFTYNLVDYLSQLGAVCKVFRNDVSLDEITQFDYEAIILSPGPSTPLQAGNMMQIIAFYHQKLPILGICLGHQALGMYFGATLQKAYQPMHGKRSEIVVVENDPVFVNLPNSFKVVRYHSLILQNIAIPLEVIAIVKYKEEVMAIKHKELPIYGLQFHPEAILTEYGKEILENWLRFIKITLVN